MGGGAGARDDEQLLGGEGDPELRDTLDFAAEASLAGAAQLSFHLVNPQPGCDLGERFAKESSQLLINTGFKVQSPPVVNLQSVKSASK